MCEGITPEGILIALARNESGVRAFSFSDNAVENQKRYTALPSLDYIPYLSDFVGRVAS